MARKIVEEKVITNSEAKAVLEKVKEEELGEFQRRTLDFTRRSVREGGAAREAIQTSAAELLEAPLVGLRQTIDIVQMTVDGLGPRGGAAHNPGEHVLVESVKPRAEIALAVTLATLDAGS